MSSHTCHAEGCTRQVPPRMFSCFAHWKMVPPHLQDMLWRVYRNGQENDKRVTKLYLLVQTRCRIAIAQREGRPLVGLIAEVRTLAASTPQQTLLQQLEGKTDAEAIAIIDAGLPALVARHQ